MEDFAGMWYKAMKITDTTDRPYLSEIRHMNTYNEFMSLYLENDLIKDTFDRWMKKLKIYGHRSFVFIGKKGSGKSTFLNYLKLRLKKDKSEYWIGITNAQDYWEKDINQNIISFDELRLANAVLNEIIEYLATNSLFGNVKAVKKEIEYKVENLDQLKITLSNAITLIENNHELLDKKLILVLDNCDLFLPHCLHEIIITWHSMLNKLPIFKVVSLRKTTHTILKSNPSDFFRTKYYQDIYLQRVPLLSILHKRIIALCGHDEYNLPFDEEFVRVFSELSNDDYRESMSKLEYLFEAIPLKEGDDLCSVFSKKWAYYLLKDGRMHNFFDTRLEKISTAFSSEKELLFLLYARPCIDRLFFNIMEDHYGLKKEYIFELLIRFIEDEFIFPSDEVNWIAILKENIEKSNQGKANLRAIRFDFKVSGKFNAYHWLLSETIKIKNKSETYLEAADQLLPLNSKWKSSVQNPNRRSSAYQERFGKLYRQKDYEALVQSYEPKVSSR